MTRRSGLGRQAASDARTPIKRVLIANRGEIAVRVIRACRDLGLESVVIYSDADEDALATCMADRSLRIGPPTAAASYLNDAAVLQAALSVGADAIHPGYGFLSENASFARSVADAGLRFIGPSAAAIEKMGNKMEARRIADEIGVPVVTGTLTAVQPGEAERIAAEMELPLIVKAAGGGGGRGMRLVRHREELHDVISSATAEAQSAFGDGAVYLESYLPNARHVEIQVVRDAHGHGIHLGERDCTIQRRYQKLIEEAPSTALDVETRATMGSAALALCDAVDYEGVGTVEFLLDQETGRHYFIEMNTRLQVEHPVTESISGIDLVELQFDIASGKELGLRQEDVELTGHAIEFRINAEDPNLQFRPSAGVVERWEPPLGPGVRVDTHCYRGYAVPPYYDSLLAKVIVSGATRAQALARARRALREFDVGGLTTTLPFHQWILGNDDFLKGQTNTGWAEATWLGRNSS